MFLKARRLTMAATALLLALGLALGSPLSQAQPPTRIQFWHAMSKHRGEVLHSLVERFNRSNAGVEVTATFVGSSDPRSGNDYNALHGKILQQLAMGTPPDVCQVYENWTTQLIEIEALAPVDRFLTGPDGLPAGDLKDFIPIFLEANRFSGGRLWTLPFNKSIYVLYYNRSVFLELGLTPPRTWDEFRQVARTITARKGIPGVVFLPNVDIFGHYLYAHEGEFIEKDQASFGGRKGADGLQFWVDTVHQDRSARPALDAEEQFKNGQAGMYIETTSRIGGFSRNPNLDLGVAMLPTGSTRAYQFAGTNLAMFARSSPERQAAAWRFIKYLTSTQVTAEWAIETGYLPVRRSAVNSPVYQNHCKRSPAYSVGIRALDYAVVQPRVAAWESIRGILNDTFFDALSLKAAPDAAIERAVALSENLLTSLRGPLRGK